MTQKFPDITENDYVDTGILDLQDRDDAVLTLFAGQNAPENPVQDFVWNDLSSHCLKWYNNNDWETIIDYSSNYISQTIMQLTYQPINQKLSDYSSVNVTGTGAISNDTWIPISSFFINKLSKDFIGNLGLGNLAYKSSIAQADIANGCISIDKVSGNITNNPVFKVGDTIPSFNAGNKTGCVKLSRSSATIYTIGASASGSTYKGNAYMSLYQMLWNKISTFGLKLYTSAGVSTSKGGSWSSDWNNNKRLELPHIDLPEANIPAEKTIKSGTNVNYTITKSGYYKLTMTGGGGGGAAMGAGTSGHQASCSGASGAGFEGEILLNKNDVLTYTIGTGGTKATGSDKSYPGAVATAGGNTVVKLNNANLVTAGGGGGGQAWWRSSYILPSGGTVTVHQNNRFSNVTKITGENGKGYTHWGWQEVKGPFNNDYGKGGSATAGSDYNPDAKNGNAGYLNIKFLAPKEYGSSDSARKKMMDNLYNGIYYFMKY